MTKNPLYHYPSINVLLKENDIKAIAEVVNELSAFEVADLMENKSVEHQTLIFNALQPDLRLKVFDYLPVRIQKKLLHLMPTAPAAALLKSLTPDDRTTLLQELPENVIDELIKQLPYEERMETLSLMGYPKGSVGRLMTPDYLAVKMDWTIDEVLDHIQAYGHDSETIEYIYVVDNEGRLLDDIKLKDLLFVPRTSKVSSITNNHFVALSVLESDEQAANIFGQCDRVALPVVDEKKILLGIVTIDDILRLANQEATEDFQKIGGMEALDEPYIEAPFLVLMKKRAGWLIILFVGEMFTATAMSYFEAEIAQAVVLALFLPLIISSGGNAGSQASTLVIRALALGEVQLKDWWKIVKLELASGLFLGILLGIVGFFRITLWSQFSTVYGEHWLTIAFTIGLALIGVVLWGTLTGAVMPLLLRKAGVDPATASAPFVATMVDVTGIIIYFLIALITLHGTLL